ncbi:hypothetical protein [Reinekea thalattae]|uniref:Uncharacterized protein n=1 Tax=Reinekea thalattae TaxID=2593301 RepID=A0A5C8ZCL5_9GAMM|nr:hypothetical protein [Reinekea thalattae]TXR54656.1 hypothetical protein FME95_09000 [Reinekea thalattae]
MKNKFLTLMFVVFSVSTTYAHSADFSTCLLDSLNGEERKLLAKWIYFGMAEHPEIKPYSKITDSDKLESDQFVGDLLSRLLLEDCVDEFKIAQKQNPNSLETAFGSVGEVAMQELMNDRNVINGLTGYTRYLDLQAITNMLAD